MVKFIRDWIIPLLFALILAYAINSFLLFKIRVPTESMVPEIMPKDQIFVTRIHNWTKLERGDVIVFRSDELNEILVKRLIGMPGDKVVFHNGYIEINGSKYEDNFVRNRDSFNGTFIVPKNNYFFVGDNRPSSYDARVWRNHFIPRNKLMGKAVLRVYPFNRINFIQ